MGLNLGLLKTQGTIAAILMVKGIHAKYEYDLDLDHLVL